MLLQTIVLGSLIALGLILGRVRLGGLSLGTSAILFAALVAGHFGLAIPAGVGTLGLALFVYSVGLAGGPTFFRGLGSQAAKISLLGSIIVITGVLVAAAMIEVFHLPSALAGGLLAGALTSTPALGAISQAMDFDPAVAVGFGVAYPIGIFAVTLMVQLTLRASGQNAAAVAGVADDSSSNRIVRCIVKITNPAVVDRRPSQLAVSEHGSCQLSRLCIDGKWDPIPSDYTIALGDEIIMVGDQSALDNWGPTLGEVRDAEHIVLDADHQRKNVVVTSPDFVDRSLAELKLRSRFAISVTRIHRHDLEFVPSSQTRLRFGDLITIVGSSESLRKITGAAGHRPRTLHETDLLSLAVGITAGLMIGSLTVDVSGLSVSLGLAGGPLLSGLVLGHFRQLGPISGSFPPASKMLLTEGGLALFLADAGVRAGGGVVEILSQSGMTVCIAAIAIALTPMFVGYFIAAWLMRLSIWTSLGAMCGGMTSTPGLAVLTSATDKPDPVTGYVAAYPAALVVITIVSPIMIQAFS